VVPEWINGWEEVVVPVVVVAAWTVFNVDGRRDSLGSVVVVSATTGAVGTIIVIVTIDENTMAVVINAAAAAAAAAEEEVDDDWFPSVPWLTTILSDDSWSSRMAFE
jgi:NADPH-dependent curcumin reductase CurA